VTLLKFRTYPRVDLAKVSNWISALSYYGLPLIELSSRRLADREKASTLSSKLKAKLILWKKTKGLEDPDELEYKYFLEGIEALCARALSPEDLDIPLFENVTLGDAVNTSSSRAKVYYLSRLGSLLASFWTNEQHHLYEATLFWLLIRSKNFNPLIQKLLSDHCFYEKGLRDELIPSQDGISRALVKKWLNYFGLLEQDQLDQSKLAIMLLYGSTFEINEQFLQRKKWKEYVGEVCRYLSNRFSIGEGAIDFGVFLDCLYSRVDRNVLRGYPSGRGHRGLPSKPSVQILELSNCIPFSSIESVQPFDILNAIAFGGFS
jgi:hypothetical protein